MANSKSVLVTGGAGFIGSNLLAALAERGERVILCDRLGTAGKWQNLVHHDFEDIVPPEKLEGLLESTTGRIKAVFHMGAISATTEQDADRLVAENYRPSRMLWNHCTAAGLPFIYASSAATYGGGEHGFDDDGSLNHLARLRPLNGYGWSKHLFDRWLARRIEDGAPKPPQWAGLKFFNVYGPNEYHKGGQASVAWHLFRQIKEGEAARLFQSHHPDYPDGGQMRDFIWVGDCVDVMLWLYDTPGVSGFLNVGTGKARTFLDLARAVFDAMETPSNIRFVPTPEEIRDKYQYFTEARVETLRRAGYEKPFTGLEEGVKRYVRDYLMQDDPYR